MVDGLGQRFHNLFFCLMFDLDSLHDLVLTKTLKQEEFK